MSENFTPLLSTTDWNEEWKELQNVRRRVDNSAYWDKRSKTFGVSDSPDRYIKDFLGRSGIEPGQSVLDMGCGTGALAIPLGKQGHEVIAADFSQGMLDKLNGELVKQDITSVTTMLMSWEDDWDALGVTENSVDLAFASRSIATSDIKDSLMRLTRVARTRACITLSTGSSPRVDRRILEAVGSNNVFGNDYQYAMNILINEGLEPELSYIVSTRKDTFDSPEDAYEALRSMVADVNSDQDEEDTDRIEGRLKRWLETHLIANPEAGKPDRKGIAEKVFCLDEPRKNVWAFITWPTDR